MHLPMMAPLGLYRFGHATSAGTRPSTSSGSGRSDLGSGPSTSSGSGSRGRWTSAHPLAELVEACLAGIGQRPFDRLRARTVGLWERTVGLWERAVGFGVRPFDRLRARTVGLWERAVGFRGAFAAHPLAELVEARAAVVIA
jgi:hypothetical protein